MNFTLPYFDSSLDLRAMSDRDDLWMLLAPLRYHTRIPDLMRVFPDGLIVVPTFWVTDLASVPRLPLVYWWYGGRVRWESVVHDFLYRRMPRVYSREIADRVFWEAMIVRKQPAQIRWPMWSGVRMGGHWAWAHADERERILNVRVRGIED